MNSFGMFSLYMINNFQNPVSLKKPHFLDGSVAYRDRPYYLLPQERLAYLKVAGV